MIEVIIQKSATKKHTYLRKSYHTKLISQTIDILRRRTCRILCEKVRLLHIKLMKTAFFASFFPENENQTTDYIHRAIHTILK